MQFYISVILMGLPDDIHEEKPSFLEFKKKRITDQPTDGPTDRPSYRDARTHLNRRKREEKKGRERKKKEKKKRQVDLE